MPNYQKRIYIIIPVHNRINFTRDCLLSLRKQTYQNFSTIVIDDGSSDGTSEMIKKEFTDVVLLHGDGNLWWAGAVNLGVKHVLESAIKGEYILTMNDDVIVCSNYLEILFGCASKNQRSLIGSIAINIGDDAIIEDGGVKITWYTARFNRLSRGREYKTLMNEEPSIVPVDVLSGRGTLIPVEAFQEVGLYDSVQLPHYGSDYEFSHRAKKKGFNLYINYKSVVTNKIESICINFEKRSFKLKRLLKNLFSKASPFCIRYRWRFARLTCPKILLASFCIFDIGRVFIGAARKKNKGTN